MKRKSKSNNNLIQSDDLCFEEEVEENGLCEFPAAATGTLVAQFCFDNNDIPVNDPIIKEPQPEVIKAPLLSWGFNPPLSFNDNKVLENKDDKAIRTHAYGITPPVNGEYFDTRRTFSFRKSTVRMLNELKASHTDINIYLNSIVDTALRHYYEYIFKEKDSQN